MKAGHDILFESFRLDLVNECLWREGQAIPLKPKAFAVLHYLVEHAGQLVTKEELLETVWPQTYVSDAVLKVRIGELREALGDNPTSPQFIETVHRRGYRFIAPLHAAPLVASSQLPVASQDKTRTKSSQLGTGLVGRETELAQLHQWLDDAVAGGRQIIFVTGEAGIGKTTLVDAFITQITAGSTIHSLQSKVHSPQLATALVGRGQCIEHYGAGEAYLPVLEALGRLCRGPEGERLITLLRQYAPTWLIQMPWLLNATEREALQREVLGATQERMLREMAEAIEAVTGVGAVREPPLLVLVLEDLHWSDHATLALISSLAQRREAARLLLIGTYRPVEIIVGGHPLKRIKQELQVHQQCTELALESLSESDVAQYLARRFSSSHFPIELVQMIHQRTDGNPLFMVNAVDHVVARGLIVQAEGQWQLRKEFVPVEVGVPESVRQMIEKQIEQLSADERQVLEAASVVGAEFSTAAVAAGVEREGVQVDELCEGLVRRQHFLQSRGIEVWPDGTVAGRYIFLHSLYQDVLYDQIAAGRRLRLHQRIGECVETAYGEQATKMAAELAVHFEQGHDYCRAIKYLQHAAINAVQRYANQEALGHLTRALELVDSLSTAAQPSLRIPVLEQRGLVRRAMGDMIGAAEDFTAMAECAQQTDHVDSEIRALLGAASALTWVDHARCFATAGRAIELSEQTQDKLLRAHARGYYASRRLEFYGWRDQDASAVIHAIEMARQAGDHTILSLYVVLYSYYQCSQSQYQEACHSAEEGLQLTLEVGDAYHYMLCQAFQAWALRHLGRWGEMLRILENALQMAEKNGHQLVAIVFQLQRAELYEQVCDFTRARELCESALQQGKGIKDVPTFFTGLLFLGLAHLGLEQYEEAFNCLNELTTRLKREPVLMHWTLYRPLHYGLSQYWLAQQDFAQARQEAERVCELAAQSGERTYLALGRQMLAEIAIAQQCWNTAEAELSQAFTIVDGAEVPLAEWRVYYTAARLSEQQRQTAKANHYWQRSAAVLTRLADSLGDAVELCQALLGAQPVRVILQRARHARIELL